MNMAQKFIDVVRDSGFEHDGKLVADMILEHYGTLEALEHRVFEMSRDHFTSMGVTTEAGRKPLYPTIGSWVYWQILEESSVLTCPDCKTKLESFIPPPMDKC
jgi:hypothetical protein